MSNWWDADPVASAPKPQASPFANAISSIESGGKYDVMGPATKTGDRAFGKYQVMGANVGPWTEEILGKRMNPRDFLANPEAQDAVFNAKFGKYVEKYGSENAAKAWFAGEKGMHNPNAKDILGTSVTAYADKFNRAMGPAQPQSGNWWDADPVASTNAPTKITVNPIADRFVDTPAPANAPQMQAGLEKRGTELTTGPATIPSQRMAIEHANVGPAMSQGATPNMDVLRKNLISTEVQERDDGAILFRDPQTGQVVETDNTKHIVMRDPADNTPKVYAKTDAASESPLVGGARVLAPGLMTGAPTRRAMIPDTSKVQPKASDIMATSKPSYRAFETQARAAPFPEGVADRIRGALDSVGLNEELAGAPIRAALKYIEEGKAASLNDIQKVKKIIGHGFGNPDKAVRDAAGVATRELMGALNDVAPTAAANLKKGDSIHSTALAVQDLQRKTDVAGLRKGRAGYGGNAVNSMRQVLSPIVQKSIEGKKTLYKPDELAAMREIVDGNWATNAARLVGQFSPSKGAINTGVGAYGGAALAGPVGYAVPALGAASNKLAAHLTGKQIERLKELVAKRSPEYAKAVERAVERYENARTALESKPTSGTLAGMIAASRALSSGLTRDGIAVSSGDLLKAIQGPVKAAAEDEQPAVPRIPGQ